MRERVRDSLWEPMLDKLLASHSEPRWGAEWLPALSAPRSEPMLVMWVVPSAPT